MIDEEKTYAEKGYRSTELSRGSGKKVWRVCDICGEGMWINFFQCGGVCKSCSLGGNEFAVGNTPNETSFKEGCVPWNKGVKDIHMSRETEFKDGQKPSNLLPVGSITERKNKKESHIRQFIKVDEPSSWEECSKYVWEKYYGNVIKGDVIHHINGDTLDNRIENLIALPRKDHPMFHIRGNERTEKIGNDLMNFYIYRYTTRNDGSR